MGGRTGEGDQGRCGRRSEVFVKNKTKTVFRVRGLGGIGWGGGGRVDVNEELKFL